MNKLKYLLFLFIIFLTPIVFASTVDITNNVYAPGVSSCDINSPANYLYYGSSGGGGTGSMGNACIGGTGCNVTNQGYLTMLVASITYNLQPSTSYNITFSNPVRTSSQNGFKNLTTSNVRGFISQYCASDEAYSLTINSVTFDGAKVIVNFTTPSYFNSYTWFRIILGNGSSNISAQDTFRLNWVNLEDLSNGSNSNDTQSIINNNNQNTQNIINNDNSNTQSIINNNNQNTQSIINNNNQNTQQQIESQRVCSNFSYTNGPLGINGKYLDSQGLEISSYDFQISDYINVYANKSYTVKQSPVWGISASVCTYTINKVLVNCTPYNAMSLITVSPTQDGYIRYSYRNITNYSTILSGEYCKNGNQAISDSIDNTNSYLTDDSDPTINSSALNDIFGRVHFTDPLSYLLTLPTQLINKIVSLSDTCSPIDLGTLYGVHLTLPCINLQNYLGSDLWTILDVILSVGLLSVILKNFYDTVSNLLTLGGEKEAKEKFSMPTPMDFLAMILGGDNK